MAASALRADSTLSPTLVVVSVTLGLSFNIVLDLKHFFVVVNSIVVLHFYKGPLGFGRGQRRERQIISVLWQTKCFQPMHSESFIGLISLQEGQDILRFVRYIEWEVADNVGPPTHRYMSMLSTNGAPYFHFTNPCCR